LITRTRDPHLVYEEVDWGLLVFFVGLFLIVGGAENAIKQTPVGQRSRASMVVFPRRTEPHAIC